MRIYPYIRLARPKHIIKNLAIFVPAFFHKQIYDCPLLNDLLIDFIAFSIAASLVYIINDIFDLRSDISHPIKRERPLAKGDIPIRNACAFGVLLLFVLLPFCGILVRFSSNVIIIIYILTNFLYSAFLKGIFLLDSIVVSSAFILRFVVGFYTANLPVDYYFLSMAFLIGLLVSLSKNIDPIKGERSTLIVIENIYLIISPLIVMLHYIFISSFDGLSILVGSSCVQIILLRFYHRTLGRGDKTSPFDMLLSDKIMLSTIVVYLLFIYNELYL